MKTYENSVELLGRARVDLFRAGGNDNHFDYLYIVLGFIYDVAPEQVFAQMVVLWRRALEKLAQH